MTNETKEKLRMINLGKKQSKTTIEKRRVKLLGHINWYKGKKLKEEKL
jgi:hypothetical protein